MIFDLPTLLSRFRPSPPTRRPVRRSHAIEILEARIAPAFAAVVELSSLSGDNGFKINGVAAKNFSGFSVSKAGDINGDGIDDVLTTGGGASYVVFGSRTPFAAELDLADLTGANGFKISGASGAVSAAGDINGDGIDDVLIGTAVASPHGTYSGASYVVFGSRTPFAANFDLSALTGANGFQISGVAAGDTAGSSVSAAGDINGDGIADLVIGAPGAAPHGAGSGASYVVFGSRTPFAANLDLSALTGANGFKISGVAAADESGLSVSGAGDLNGDGIDDVAIVADGAVSYVVFGKRTPFAANLNLSALTGANGFKISGDFALLAVSAAGDINGDGIDDLVLGALNGPNGKGAGSSYVVFGSRTPFAADFKLSSLNGANGFSINSARDGQELVSKAGDINGDGIDDLLIGTPLASPHGTQSGASYVVFGSRIPFAANLNLSALNGANGFKINGVAAGDTAGSSVSAAGDINGDGIDDLLIGAPRATPHGESSGASYVVFGDAPATVTLDVSSASALESSTSGLTYTFTRTHGNLGQPLTVSFTTAGTATFTSDYTASSTDTFDFAAGTLTFAANSNTASITLLPVDDASVEGSETATLTLAAGDPYLVSGGPATGTITDNDTATIGFAITGSTIGEGAGNAPLSLVLTIAAHGTGTPVLAHDVTFHLAPAGGTATGHDYILPGVATFASGAVDGAMQTVNLGIVDDASVESSETVVLGLSIGAGSQVAIAGGAAAMHTVTITDDDTYHDTSAISIADASVLEGNGGTATLEFTVTLSAANFQPVTVSYTTANGTALAPGDYTALLPTLLTFAPGEASKTISVPISGDTLYEGGADETFLVKLSAPGNATLDRAQAVGTILHDDAAPASVAAIDAKHPFTFFDADHDKVTVKLTGHGNGTVSLNGGGAGGADISEIQLHATDLTSALSVTVIKDRMLGNGLVSIGEVTTDGSLGSFLAKTSDLAVGGFRAAGTVKTIAVHDLLEGAILTAGAATDKLALTLGHAADGTMIQTSETISALTASGIGVADVQAAAVNAISVTAGALFADFTSLGAIGRITIKGGGLASDLTAASFGPVTITGGDFVGTLTSLATAATLLKTPALTSLSITGGSLSGEVNALGAVGAITVKTGSVGGDLSAARFGAISVTGGNFSGTLTSLATAATLLKIPALTSLAITGGSLSGDVNALGAVGAITVKTGGFSGHVSAASFGAVAVTGGDFSGTLTSLTPAATLARILALKSLSITNGDLTGDVRVLGTAGAITVKGAATGPGGNVTSASVVASAIASLTVAKNFTGSTVLAGADLGADYAPGGSDDTFAGGKIGAVLISGSVSGASVIGAGLATTNAAFKDGDDTIIGGTASVVASFTVRGTADPDSYFVAGLFKAAPKVAGVKVVLPDPRFKAA